MSLRRIGLEQERAIQEVLVQLFAALLCSGKSDDDLRTFATSCVKIAKKEMRSRTLVGGSTYAQDF
jgi:hypothetical protein